LSDLEVSWHFIGHLQSNKVKAALESFACIHTLDRESLARELNRAAQKLGKQFRSCPGEHGDEESKSGLAPEDVSAFFDLASSLDGLDIRGLMALPPYYDDPEEVRPHFRTLRELLERLRTGP